jgi:hypothetical protein
MEFILGIVFILCGSGTVCYVVRTKEQYAAQVAIAKAECERSCDPDYVQLRLAEIARERWLLSDGGNK